MSRSASSPNAAIPRAACAEGNPSGNTDTWTCAGPNGGVDATCEVGVCGTADTYSDGCAPGEWEDIADPPSGIATWNCLGSVDASTNDDTVCTDGVGVCGPTQGACDQGNASITTTPRWTCEGGNPDPLVTSDDAECYVGVCGDPTYPRQLHRRRSGRVCEPVCVPRELPGQCHHLR